MFIHTRALKAYKNGKESQLPKSIPLKLTSCGVPDGYIFEQHE